MQEAEFRAWVTSNYDYGGVPDIDNNKFQIMTKGVNRISEKKYKITRGQVIKCLECWKNGLCRQSAKYQESVSAREINSELKFSRSQGSDHELEGD